MYCVEVKTKGQYNSIEVGIRIFFRKKPLLDFLSRLNKSKCEYDFYKLTKCGYCLAKK